MVQNARTNRQHWDSTWVRQPRMRLPSGLFIGTRNIQRSLSRHLRPGMRVLEIGCAPGKILAWAAKIQKVEVSGIDYSTQGIDNAKRLFNALGISGNFKCEDVFDTSLPESSFDCVFSCGVVEHFNEAKELVEIHVRLLKPGGKAIITIPNYSGIYGRVQRHFDPNNLFLHNLEIMTPSSLVALAPAHMVDHVCSYPFGRLTSTLVSFDRALPKWFAWVLNTLLNGVGLLQPIDIPALCPILVLEMTKKIETQ